MYNVVVRVLLGGPVWRNDSASITKGATECQLWASVKNDQGSLAALCGDVCSDWIPSLPYNPNPSGWEAAPGACVVVRLKCIAKL
jgi:hypothetical protein